jgi:hypothetical protein
LQHNPKPVPPKVWRGCLAEIRRTVLGLTFLVDVGLRDQCLRTVLSLGQDPFLLVYDDAQSPRAREDWLSPAGLVKSVRPASEEELELRARLVRAP